MLPNSDRVNTANSETTLKKKATWHYVAVSLTLLAAVATLFDQPKTTHFSDTLLLVFATAGSVTTLWRQLPLQSVLFAAGLTALLGAAAHGLSAGTGIPLGPVSFGPASGPKLFNIVPWSVGLLWIIVIFNSRGVARLILRPWRKIKNYGFILLGLTAGLSLVFDLGLEPYAHLKQLWLWQPTKIHVEWYRASPMTFIGWTFVSLMILAIIMPYLIRKQPGNNSSPDYSPLLLWLGAMILFAINAGLAACWPALTVDVLIVIGVGTFSWRGACW